MGRRAGGAGRQRTIPRPSGLTAAPHAPVNSCLPPLSPINWQTKRGMRRSERIGYRCISMRHTRRAETSSTATDRTSSRSPWLAAMSTKFRGNHRNRKVVKSAGMNDVALLVTVAEVVAGRRATDSDRRAGGFLRAWLRAGQACLPAGVFCVVCGCSSLACVSCRPKPGWPEMIITSRDHHPRSERHLSAFAGPCHRPARGFGSDECF